MKMLVSDYDGTFFRNKEELGKNIEAVKRFREAGNIFVLATGRNLDEMYEEIDKYNIPFDYLILCNGGVIFGPNKNVLKEFTIPTEALHILKKVTEEHPKHVELVAFIHAFGETFTIEDHNYVKVKIRMDNHEEAIKVAKEVDEKCKVTKTYVLDSRYSLRSVESCYYLTDKSVAVEALANMLNIDKKDITTVGDHYNDAEMITKFNGFAIIGGILLTKQELKTTSNVSSLIDKIITDF